MTIRQHKYLLDESQMPTSWYNIIPDLPAPPPPPLHPGKAYLSGSMIDSGLSDEDLASALAAVPVMAG